MAGRIVVQNGMLKNIDAPPAPLFLTSTHPGAYTTCRTGGEGSCILLWERHLLRLAQSLSILAEAKPQLYPVKPRPGSTWDDAIRPLVQSSLEAGLPKALEGRKVGEELSITTLVCGGSTFSKPQKPYDVYVHISGYIPSSSSGGVQLAIVGPGREIALSKFSEWVRTRQSLEKFRPPLVTELLLSNDGDRILEGSITNFFVVCYQETRLPLDDDDFHLSTSSKWFGYEVQTAPITDGVLPGVIRQLVIEICADEGIPLREVAPSLSTHKLWKEAFISNSLRLIQHVDSIRVPSSWDQTFYTEGWEEISWKSFHLEGLGAVTKKIQTLVLERAMSEGYRFMDILR